MRKHVIFFLVILIKLIQMKVENQETGDFDSGNELYDDNSTMNNSLIVDDTINTWIGEPEETMSTSPHLKKKLINATVWTFVFLQFLMKEE